MTIVVYSISESLRQHINYAVDADIQYKSDLKLSMHEIKADMYLIHCQSYDVNQRKKFIHNPNINVKKIAFLDDTPSVEAMLAYTQVGICAYGNSYMAAPHYKQLVQLVKNGQSWFPADLLTQVLSLAHANISDISYDEKLKMLTPREKQIALSVAEGKSNKVVAEEHDISERTVKAHLTHIYEKWDVKDRMALVLYLKQQGLAKTGT